jgi:hypothetical protein
MKIRIPLFDFLKKEILMTLPLCTKMGWSGSIFSVCFFLFLCSLTATAQQYPVDCRISIIPPYANRFYDYQNSPQRFKVTLLLRDNTKPTLDVVLQIRLKGPGLVIENPGDFFTAQPITLSPGRPQTLSGLELSDNFSPANLETQGIELADLFTGVGLPPGPYEWEVRAFELYRDRQVSNTASFRMNLALNYPPLLNQPTNNAQLSPTQPQSLNFSWMPRPTASLAARQGLLYTLMLYEVPLGEDPNAVVNSGSAPFRVIETGQTNYFYGPFEVPLEVGKTYAWQVQVSDINGQETYVNNGYSEVHTFTYGQNTCPTPTNVLASVAHDGAINFSWNPVAEASGYTLRYKPAGETTFTTVRTDEPEYLLLYQQAGRSYAYQLSTTCQYSGSSPYTAWENFEILDESSDLDPEDTTAYISDPELTYEPEIFEPDESQLTAPQQEEPSIEDLLNTPIKIYIPGDENAIESPLSLPTSPTNLSEKEIKALLKSKKPTCAGIVSSYSCGNHDTTPMYAGATVSVAAGDEVAMNSLVISIVDIDGGGGNGSGKIKIPMFQNAEVGVTLSGIKVAEGGCIIEGKAELSGVDIALLNEQQRAKLAIAYDIFVQATDAIYDHSEVISETYNSIV